MLVTAIGVVTLGSLYIEYKIVAPAKEFETENDNAPFDAHVSFVAVTANEKLSIWLYEFAQLLIMIKNIFKNSFKVSL